VPRAVQVKVSAERLSDRVAIGVLTRVFPPSFVDDVLGRTGRLEQRSRLLPARMVVYFVLAMCLFSGQAMRSVKGARIWTRRARTTQVPEQVAVDSDHPAAD
jgi:hypothetical protein